MAQSERARYQALRAVAQEFSCSASMLDTWVSDGTSPDEARAGRASIAADEERRRLDSEIRQVAPITGPAAVALLTSAFFGRPDVLVEVPEAQRAAFSGAGRDALAAVAGIAGRGASPDVAWAGVLAGRGGAGVNTTPTGGIVFAASGGAAGAAGAVGRAATFPASVEDSLRMIVTHDWTRGGELWRACTRVVRAPDFRPRDWRVAMSGASSSEVAQESGSPSFDAGPGAGWLSASLQVKRRPTSTTLSYERWVSDGGIELGQWLQGQVSLWHDALDSECAALLGGAAVRTVSGTYDDDHFDKAIALLNRQTVAGATLGASKPIAVVGENRRGIALGLAPRAEGDMGSLLSRVECSAVIDPDFAVLIHPRFMPCMLAHMRADLTPIAAMGPAVKGDGGTRSDLGAVVAQDRSAPALTVDSDGNVPGAVRLTV